MYLSYKVDLIIFIYKSIFYTRISLYSMLISILNIVESKIVAYNVIGR